MTGKSPAGAELLGDRKASERGHVVFVRAAGLALLNQCACPDAGLVLCVSIRLKKLQTSSFGRQSPSYSAGRFSLISGRRDQRRFYEVFVHLVCALRGIQRDRGWSTATDT